MKTYEFTFYGFHRGQPLRCGVQFAGQQIQRPSCQKLVLIPNPLSGSGLTQVEPKPGRDWDPPCLGRMNSAEPELRNGGGHSRRWHRPLAGAERRLAARKGKGARAFPCVCFQFHVLLVRSGQWPDGTGESPVLPMAIIPRVVCHSPGP